MGKSKPLLIVLFLILLSLVACQSPNQQQINAAVVPEAGSKLEIHVINVNQGDCFLIISPSNKRILIDAGNNGKGSGFVLPCLKNLNITSLDYIFASHYHSDHVGGLDEVVNGLGGNAHIINAAFDRGGNYNSGAYKDYLKAIGDKRKTISPGQTIDLGDGVIMKCIASNGDIPTGRVYSGTDENTLSVVLVLKYHSFDMYFGGDSNIAIEPSLAPYAGDVDVYKVSHHGSATSSSQQLLDSLKPEVSVISVGDGNTYGHPSSETISRLVAMNSYIYQTETGSAPPPSGKGEVANGNFKIVTDGYSYTISGSSLTARTRLTDFGTLETYAFSDYNLNYVQAVHRWPWIYRKFWRKSIPIKYHWICLN
jgi:beta-lactamase superfamily II metal-dependent hydrolase